jgi:hypothetical protein
MPAKTRTLVVLEEAHLFVPEQASGASTEMVGAIKRIARQGRSAGIGLMIVDQRPQDVAKSIISQSELLICHQLVHNLDRKALEDWVKAYDRAGEGKTFLGSLAELAPGEAWAWSPAWLKLFVRTKVDRRETYDSGATPNGSPASAPKAKAAVDLDSLRTHLAKVVDQAKAEDPKTLRTEIARLTKELAAKPAPAAVAAPVVKRVEIPVMKDGQIAKVEKVCQQMAGLFERFSGLVDQFKVAAGKLVQPVPQAHERAVIPNRQAFIPKLPVSIPKPPRRGRVDHESTGPLASEIAEWFQPAHQRILDALAWLETFGIPEPDRSIAAAIAGASPTSSSFTNNLSRLNTAGLLTYPGASKVALSGDGRALARFPEQAVTLDGLHQAWRRCSCFQPAHVRILDAVIAQYPEVISREDLAIAIEASPTSSSFTNNISKLRSMGLIDYPLRGLVRASVLLFPEGK